jgi:hypothetical protein
MKMIEKQKEERKQIQAKMVELNASTNVESIKTVYQSAIDEVRERLNQRKMFAERFKASKLKETMGGEEDDAASEGKEDGEGGRGESAPAVDMRKKIAEREDEEFRPYYDLKKDDDWTDFQLKSRHWNPAKLKRFHLKRLQYQTKEFEENELAKIKDSFKNKSHKIRPQSEWKSDLTVYPKPISVGKNGKPIFDKAEIERWEKEQKDAQAKIDQRRAKLKKTLTTEEQKKVDKERKDKYDNMIRDMRNE